MLPYNPPIRSFDGDTGFFGRDPRTAYICNSDGVGNFVFGQQTTNHSSNRLTSLSSLSFGPPVMSSSSSSSSSPLPTAVVPSQQALIPGSAICANVNAVYLFSSDPHYFSIRPISGGDFQKCVVHFHLHRDKRHEMGRPDVYGIDITFSLQGDDGCRIGHSISLNAKSYLIGPEDHDVLKLRAYGMLQAMEKSGFFSSPTNLLSFLKEGIHRLMYDYSNQSTGVVSVKYFEFKGEVLRPTSKIYNSRNEEEEEKRERA